MAIDDDATVVRQLYNTVGKGGILGRHLVVEALEVDGEVVDALGVQETADDVRRFQAANCFAVLQNCTGKVVLAVQVVSATPVDVRKHAAICLHGACGIRSAQMGLIITVLNIKTSLQFVILRC